MRRSALALLSLALLVACESDVLDGLIDEPNVASMRIVLGTQAININCTNGTTSGPITLSQGAMINLSATFFTPDGDVDPNVTQASFQLNVTTGGSVGFQRNNVNPFAGTLTAGGAGTSQTLFALYNIETQQNECGPWPVTTVVN